MLNNFPDITFILPIYKTPEDFLTQCVQSIIGQTHTNIEIILVDDGSPDNCPTLCDNFAKEDKRIIVIHQKNKGVGNARNTGLKRAKGTWVCFVDPDDWLQSEMASIALTEVSDYYKINNKQADILMCNYIKEYGKVSSQINHFTNTIHYCSNESITQLQLLTLELTSNVGAIWSKLYRKEFLLSNTLFSNENLPRGQDVEYNVRVFQKASNVLAIKNALYHYRYDENTASTAFNNSYAEYVKLFIFALYDDVLNIQNNDAFIKKFYERCVHTLLSLTVRYTFHKNNPDSYYKKRKIFLEFCSNEVIQKSIQMTPYSAFSLARKAGLFCLKHKYVFGLYLIAKIRQLQYTIKT